MHLISSFDVNTLEFSDITNCNDLNEYLISFSINGEVYFDFEFDTKEIIGIEEPQYQEESYLRIDLTKLASVIDIETDKNYQCSEQDEQQLIQFIHQNFEDKLKLEPNFFN